MFRRWKERDGGGVIALFPDASEGPGRVDSYENVGQHGSADWGIVRKTKPAKPKEYRDLLQELRRIGYKPCVVRRTRPAAYRR
jgi:hypothetical protein